MNLPQLEAINAVQPDTARLHKVKQVLSEVYELLESYAPMWYSEELRGRICSVLEPGRPTNYRPS